MTLRTLFRTMVVLYPVLVAAGAVYPYLAEPFLSEDWRDLVAWNGNGSWFFSDDTEGSNLATELAMGVFLLALLVLFGAVQVGLFLFQRWARTTYLVLTVVALPTAPLYGLAVILPIETAFWEAVSITDGFTLALAYFSPLRREFRKRSHVHQPKEPS